VTRVIGLGSPFGEDRAGWLVIDRLQGQVPASVDVVALDRPGAALVNWMRECEHLILIDAVLAPEQCGTYALLAIDELAQPSSLSGHMLNLAETVALAQTLGQAPGKLEIYGINIRNLETLSKPVSNCIALLSAQLIRRLQTSQRP
jgi:hydrogenase maturation protease